jgi:hypothetical protein
MDFAAAALRGVLKALQIETSVRVPEEARAAVVAALDYMVRNTGQFQTGRPRHASSTRSPSKGSSAVNCYEKIPLTPFSLFRD